MNTKDFYGVYTALVTPFKNHTQAIDFKAVGKLIDYQIANGINGIVIIGTTGESPTLTSGEQADLIRFTVDKVQGKVPVIVGTGSNDTRHAVELTKQADVLGADALLVVAPYYNKPTQEGLFLHFSKIAEATSKPIILYSIPSRCGIEISVKTVQRLRAKFPHVVGIKEAGGSCNRVSDLVKELDKDFVVISGDDALTLPFMAIGAKGVISVASNFIVSPLVKMVQLALNDEMEKAAEINKQYYPFFKAIFVETSPSPIKQVLFLKGILESPEVRLPLCQMEDANILALKNCIDSMPTSI